MATDWFHLGSLKASPCTDWRVSQSTQGRWSVGPSPAFSSSILAGPLLSSLVLLSLAKEVPGGTDPRLGRSAPGLQWSPGSPRPTGL